MNIVKGPFKYLICLGIVLFFQNSCNVYGQADKKNHVKFIDYFFENASQLSWKIQGDTIVKISLPR